jgi:hypothetical protein
MEPTWKKSAPPSTPINPVRFATWLDSAKSVDSARRCYAGRSMGWIAIRAWLPTVGPAHPPDRHSSSSQRQTSRHRRRLKSLLADCRPGEGRFAGRPRQWNKRLGCGCERNNGRRYLKVEPAIDRVNGNQGAESTLAFLLSLVEMPQAQNMLTSFQQPITTEDYYPCHLHTLKRCARSTVTLWPYRRRESARP